MKHVLTPAGMREADSYFIEKAGFMPAVLMENAAHSCYNIIRNGLGMRACRILVVCGSGNNGGDGLALARFLADENDVRVLLAGDIEKMSPETSANYGLLPITGIKPELVLSSSDLKKVKGSYGIIIEALTGNGGSGGLREPVASLVARLNKMKGLKIALDIPAGLDPYSGNAGKVAFRADYTLTMHAPKTGLLINDGKDFAGTVLTAGLGVPSWLSDSFASARCMEAADLQALLPLRKKNSSKFDNGRVTVIAGSEGMEGAGALCANACIRSGAGLVHLFTERRHKKTLPEVMAREIDWENEPSILKMQETVEKSSVLIIGPGFGDDEKRLLILEKLVRKYAGRKKIIIDADGLRLVNGHTDYLTRNMLLTPHIGEFARMTGLAADEIRKDPLATVRHFAGFLNCNILLKGPGTVICNGKDMYINTSGNELLATAGSGDVLSGLIGALAARGLPVSEAGVAGAFAHGLCADHYRERKYDVITAGDLINAIPGILKKGL